MKIINSFKFLLVLIFDIIMGILAIIAAPFVYGLLKMSSKWRIKSYYLAFMANSYHDSAIMHDVVINEYSDEDKKDLLDLDE